MPAIPFRIETPTGISFKVDFDAPCPCDESSKSPAECCLASGAFSKEPKSTSPAPPRTGTSLQGCYADALGDCDGSLSREHFLSKTLLKHFDSHGGLPSEAFGGKSVPRRGFHRTHLSPEYFVSGTIDR